MLCRVAAGRGQITHPPHPLSSPPIGTPCISRNHLRSRNHVTIPLPATRPLQERPTVLALVKKFCGCLLTHQPPCNTLTPSHHSPQQNSLTKTTVLCLLFRNLTHKTSTFPTIPPLLLCVDTLSSWWRKFSHTNLHFTNNSSSSSLCGHTIVLVPWLMVVDLASLLSHESPPHGDGNHCSPSAVVPLATGPHDATRTLLRGDSVAPAVLFSVAAAGGTCPPSSGTHVPGAHTFPDTPPAPDNSRLQSPHHSAPSAQGRVSPHCTPEDILPPENMRLRQRHGKQLTTGAACALGHTSNSTFLRSRHDSNRNGNKD